MALSVDTRDRHEMLRLLPQPPRSLCASHQESLSTPSLPGAYAAHHFHGPGIQGQLPRENTWHAPGCCNVTPASAAASSPHIPYPSLPPASVSQSPLISHSFNPLLSGGRTDARGQATCRCGAKSKAEPQELCEQRRERGISLCSLRSSRLNLHNQLDVPCNCGMPEWQLINPKLRQWTLGATVDLGFAVCDWLLSAFSVYLSIDFSASYHWWICLLVSLLSSFSFYYFFIS